MYNVRPWLGENQLNYVYLGDKHLLAAYLGDKLVYGNTIKVSYKTIKCNFYRGCRFSYWSNVNPAYIGSITYYFSNVSSQILASLTDNFYESSTIKTAYYVNNTLESMSTDSKYTNSLLSRGALIDSKDIQIWTTSDIFYFGVEIDQYPKVASGNYAYLMWSNLTDVDVTSSVNDFYRELEMIGSFIDGQRLIKFYNVTSYSELNFYGLTNVLGSSGVGTTDPGGSTGKNILIYWNTNGTNNNFVSQNSGGISTFAVIKDTVKYYTPYFTNIKITVMYDNNTEDVISVPDIIGDPTTLTIMNPYGYHSSKLSYASQAFVFISGNIYYQPHYDTGRYGDLCINAGNDIKVRSFSKTNLEIEWTVTPPNINPLD